MMDLREGFAEKKRIIVKVGSSTITHNTGRLNYYRIEKLVREIADLENEGHDMILVTSAAVSAGMDTLGITKRPDSIRKKQALASVGQGVLMHVYEQMFREYGQKVASVAAEITSFFCSSVLISLSCFFLKNIIIRCEDTRDFSHELGDQASQSVWKQAGRDRR